MILNVFFIWYVYTLLKKLLFVSENIGDFLEDLQNYADHIESVYSMETYYGDETIEMLLNHSRDLVKSISAYRDIYEITQADLTLDEEEEEIDAA